MTIGHLQIGPETIDDVVQRVVGARMTLFRLDGKEHSHYPSCQANIAAHQAVHGSLAA